METDVASKVGPSSYFDVARIDTLEPATRELVRRRVDVLGPAYRLFYEQPVQIVRGEGVHLYDADGVEYLDCYNNVASLGHAHPRVTAAIAEQAAVLNTHTRYLHEGIVRYAEDLLSTMPDELGHVMFTCTGSEAGDLALRIAKRHTGGTGVIVTRNAYHGVTTEIAAISPSLGGLDSLPDWVRVVPTPDAYRVDPVAPGLRRPRHVVRRAGAGADRRPRRPRHRPRRVRRRLGLRLRRRVPRPRGVPRTGARRRTPRGRRLPRRRGAAGLRPTRRHDVGLPAARHRGGPVRPRHRHHRQADGQRHADRGDDHASRGHRGVRAGHALLQHLRRQRGVDRRGAGRARRRARRAPAGERARGRRLAARDARATSRTATPSSATCAARGCSSASSSSCPAPTRSPTRRSPCGSSTACATRHVLLGTAGIDNNILKVRPPIVFSQADADRFVAELDATLTDVGA